MKLDDSIPVAQNARERLPRLLKKFYAAGREAVRERDPSLLHSFRLETKRVRYTLELFGRAYGPEFEKLLKALRKAQSALGEIQDCASAAQLVEDAEFRRWVERQQQKRIRDLRKYWKGKLDAAGEERRWLRYLKTAAAQVRQSDSPKVNVDKGGSGKIVRRRQSQ